MDGGLFDLFARGLFAIFKRHPVIAYSITITIIIVVLSVWIVNAKNPDDRAYPVIGLVFVFVVIMGRIVAFIRNKVLKGLEAPEGDTVDLVDDVSSTSGPSVNEALPNIQNPLPQSENQIAVTEDKSGRPENQLNQKFLYNLSVIDGLLILLIGAVCMSLGYLFSYLFGITTTVTLAERFVPAWDESTTAYYLDSINTPIAHMICGLPLVFCMGTPVFAALYVLLAYLLRNYGTGRMKVIFAISSFLFGLILFVPIQVLLLIGISF